MQAYITHQGHYEIDRLDYIIFTVDIVLTYLYRYILCVFDMIKSTIWSYTTTLLLVLSICFYHQTTWFCCIFYYIVCNFYFLLFMPMKKYITEFVGTFFLVFVIGLAVANAGTMAPVAIGFILMVMVYAWGHVSGAHYNPAVTLGLALSKKINMSELIPYWIAQLAGGLVAAFLASMVVGKSLAFAPGAGVSVGSAMIVEILFTFALVYVVLNVAASKSTEGNSYFGLAIWCTVLAAAYAGGSISGGAFNPAVGISHVITHMVVWGGSLAPIRLYIVWPLAGWALASFVYGLTAWSRD